MNIAFFLNPVFNTFLSMAAITSITWSSVKEAGSNGSKIFKFDFFLSYASQ